MISVTTLTNKRKIVGTGYYNCTVADKLVFAGFLHQDALLDALKNNGYLEEDEEDEDGNDEEEI